MKVNACLPDLSSNLQVPQIDTFYFSLTCSFTLVYLFSPEFTYWAPTRFKHDEFGLMPYYYQSSEQKQITVLYGIKSIVMDIYRRYSGNTSKKASFLSEHMEQSQMGSQGRRGVLSLVLKYWCVFVRGKGKNIEGENSRSWGTGAD